MLRHVLNPGACFCQAAFDCVDDGVLEAVTVTTVEVWEVVDWLDGVALGDPDPVLRAPAGDDGEDPPVVSGGEFGLTEVGVGVDPALEDELDELGDGATDVDDDASLIIVNSGLALPESPNKTTI